MNDNTQPAPLPEVVSLTTLYVDAGFLCGYYHTVLVIYRYKAWSHVCSYFYRQIYDVPRYLFELLLMEIIHNSLCVKVIYLSVRESVRRSFRPSIYQPNVHRPSTHQCLRVRHAPRRLITKWSV